MTIATQSEYLASNNLHFKPISARILRLCHTGLTAVHKYGESSGWETPCYVVNVVGSVATNVVCIPLAMIEMGIATSIASLGLTINYILYSNKNEFLQKHTIKMLSSAVHNFGLICLCISMFVAWSKYYTAIAACDQGFYLGSAMIAQAYFGVCLDKAAGRSERCTEVRAQNLFREIGVEALRDCIEQLRHDINFRLAANNIASLDEYFAQNPDDLATLQRFNLENIRTNIQYQTEFRGFVFRLLAAMQIGTMSENNLSFDLNQYGEEEKEYQEYLKGLLMTSIIDVYKNRSQLLDDAGKETGKERIEAIDAGTYMPLTNYAQYRELLTTIGCPSVFENLPEYDGRRERLLALRSRVQELSPPEREQLVVKILSTKDVDLPAGELQEIFNEIGNLAQALNQGKLMTKTTLNPNLWGNGDPFQYENLFQKAYQDALAEVGG